MTEVEARALAPGARVHMTQEAKALFDGKRWKDGRWRGTVVRMSRSGSQALLVIQRDGIKLPDRWAPVFWEVSRDDGSA